MQAYWTSAAGRSRQRATRSYFATFVDDGTFRFDDIPPGNYRLELKASARAATVEGTRKLTSQVSLEAEIQVAHAKDSNLPIDLGTMELKP